MAERGFYFRKIEITGKHKEPASLEFEPGLNVISGASDTGKSYVLDCLGYMTGGKNPPKSIQESRGYETLWLEIRTWDNTPYTLERSLRGGDFHLYRMPKANIGSDTEPEILKVGKPTKKTMSISAFLLALCGMSTVQLRTNAAGKLRNISFRDVVHMTIIGEERIYTTGSPVHATGQFTSMTVEQSFFRYLLTGIDDSSAIAAAAAKPSKSDIAAKREVIETVIEETEALLRELIDDEDDLEGRHARLNNAVRQAMSARAMDREHRKRSILRALTSMLA